jgi:DNA topoisomerase I
VRRGGGFSYHDDSGIRIEDREALARIAALTIPPAWRDVWICADPLGHLQATGIDAAGRKQYLYHERWRAQRDRRKFERMTEFGRGLPRLRRAIAVALRGEDPSRTRVLACAVRLLDIGLFRIGGEEYADEEGGVGLATLRKEHVGVNGSGQMCFDYPAKDGVRRVLSVKDPRCAHVLRTLLRRRGGPELFAYRDRRGWSALRSDEINAYLKELMDDEFSAKDFRTWNATVAAAAALAARNGPARRGSRKRAVSAAVAEVAELVGNTPAVARRSYIDPRVIDRFMAGDTVAAAHLASRAKLERAVLTLLED